MSGLPTTGRRSMGTFEFLMQIVIYVALISIVLRLLLEGLVIDKLRRQIEEIREEVAKLKGSQ